MSRDAPINAEKDYTSILDEEFPKIDSLAQVRTDLLIILKVTTVANTVLT